MKLAIASILSVLLAILSVPPIASAAPPAGARITKLIVGSAGDVYVYVGEDFLSGTDHGSCTRQDRYILSPTHSAYSEIYAQILTAFAGRDYIQAYINANNDNGCAGRDSPVITGLLVYGE